MGQRGSSETSVLNHHTLRNKPEDGRSQFNSGGSLRSRTNSVVSAKHVSAILVLLKPIGYYIYHQVRSAHIEGFMSFVIMLKQRATTPLYNINWLVSLIEIECVYCAVRKNPLNVTGDIPVFKWSKLDACTRCNNLRNSLWLSGQTEYKHKKHWLSLGSTVRQPQH